MEKKSNIKDILTVTLILLATFTIIGGTIAFDLVKFMAYLKYLTH